MGNLALAYRNQGNLVEAVKLENKLKEVRIRLGLGPGERQRDYYYPM
jgi:hypothetical protein